MARAGLRMPAQRDRHDARARPLGALAELGLPAHRAPGLHARRARRRHRAHARGVRADRRAAAWTPRRSARCCSTSRCSAGASSSSRSCATDNDNVVIVCSIENLDPMGVHTGDSVTVAPQQTLTDRLYQQLRDQAMAVIRAVGVETGGSNVQFAVNPATEEILVIEMNPRVSRSSALASKATGFPIAKIAARLAVGYALEEIDNDITQVTPGELRADDRLRRRQVAALRLREVRRRRRAAVDAHEERGGGDGDRAHLPAGVRQGDAQPRARRPGAAGRPSATRRCWRPLERPTPDRYDVLLEGFRRGDERRGGRARARASTPGSCASCARWRSTPRRAFAGERSFKAVDTCAAEFEARTPYYYSGWERAAAHEVERGDRPSVVILGSGPNRIGQGIEFDYCCVHAAMTVRDSGRDAVMINCNPETVSTDYDTSDRLYFEPLTLEDVLGRPRGRAAGGRHRPVRRPDAAEARRRPGRGRRAAARHERRRDRPRRGSRALRRAAGPAGLPGAALRRRRAPWTRRWRPPSTSASRCSCARATSSAGARWRSSTRARAWRTTCRARCATTGARSSSTASWRTRSRSTSTRCATARTCGSAASCSTSRRPASTPATAPACCRRTRWATRCSTRSASRRAGSRSGSASSGC